METNIGVNERDMWWKPPKQNLTLEEFKSDICQYVRFMDWVSFAEMRRRYGSQAQGEYTLRLPRFPNIILFEGLSYIFCSAISDLLIEKKIHPHGSSPLVYLIDGMEIQLPLAKRKPLSGDYKRPHWLPVTFRYGEHCSTKDCPYYIRPSTEKETS